MTDKPRGILKSQPPGYSFNTNCYDIFQTIFISAGELHFECYDDNHKIYSILTPGNLLVLRKESQFSLSSPVSGYGGIAYLNITPSQDNLKGFSFFISGTHWMSEMVGLMQFALLHPQNYNQEAVSLMGRIIANQALYERFSPKISRNQTSDKYWGAQIKQITQNSLYRSPHEYHEQIQALNLSYRQLSRIFIAETGMSIKSYQINERIREAKRLLQSTGFSVSDIAYELHYTSSQKFAAQFRKITGMTATEFRNIPR